MKPEIRPAGPRACWEAYLQEFNRQNEALITRLGVIKPGAGAEEYWLEDGLPLAAVGLEAEDHGAPVVQIMLGGKGDVSRNVTHTVPRVKTLRLRLTDDGRDDGLDIEDAEGTTTVLRFEPQAKS